MCSIVSLLTAHSAPSFLSFRPIPVFSLLVPTTKSRDDLSFFCTLFPQVLRNFLCHTPLILPVVSGFFNSFPSFLLVRVFVPVTHFYIPPSFCSQSFHFFTGIPVSLVVFLSLLLLRVVSCTLSFHPFCLQTLPLAFLLSPSPYSSYTLPSLSNLAFLCPLPSQMFFLHFLYLFLFLPSPYVPYLWFFR
jgi:hypothetical protein